MVVHGGHPLQVMNRLNLLLGQNTVLRRRDLVVVLQTLLCLWALAAATGRLDISPSSVGPSLGGLIEVCLRIDNVCVRTQPDAAVQRRLTRLLAPLQRPYLALELLLRQLLDGMLILLPLLLEYRHLLLHLLQLGVHGCKCRCLLLVSSLVLYGLALQLNITLLKPLDLIVTLNKLSFGLLGLLHRFGCLLLLRSHSNLIDTVFVRKPIDLGLHFQILFISILHLLLKRVYIDLKLLLD